MYVYECPRCRKRTETVILHKRIKCGDCLVNHTEIVEMILEPAPAYPGMQPGGIAERAYKLANKMRGSQ